MPPVGRGRGRGHPQLNLDDNQPAVPALPAAMMGRGRGRGIVPIGAPIIPQFAPMLALNPAVVQGLQQGFVPMNPGAGPVVNAPFGAGIVPIPQVGPPEQNITGEIPRDAPSENILYRGDQ